jgi:prepilin-type N-terminal cleavage/methylation domain-containing protein
MVRRGRGFTLIELLVVIAIIAILAAMLFPVFARARESARKIQCLSNVKNVAMAVQMYLADWDRYMVLEHRAEVLAYYDAKNPDGGYSSSYHCAHGTYFANPYLRMPVLLDEYIRNRDVWLAGLVRLAAEVRRPGVSHQYLLPPVPERLGRHRHRLRGPADGGKRHRGD